MQWYKPEDMLKLRKAGKKNSLRESLQTSIISFSDWRMEEEALGGRERESERKLAAGISRCKRRKNLLFSRALFSPLHLHKNLRICIYNVHVRTQNYIKISHFISHATKNAYLGFDG